MNLETLTLKELKKLRKDVDKTIADFENRKKARSFERVGKEGRGIGLFTV